MPIPIDNRSVITTKGIRGYLVQTMITKRNSLIWPRLCNVVTSHTQTDFFGALGTVPQLEEVGFNAEMPEHSDFFDYYQSWTNRIFKLIFQLNKSAMYFDQTGQIRRLLEAVSARVFNFADKLFIDRLLVASTEIQSYDSNRNGAGTTYFFSTTHKLDGATAQSNIVDGYTTYSLYTDGTTTALSTLAITLWKDFNTAYATLRGFKDDRGQPWHPNELPADRMIILCSPLLQQAFELAFRSGFISNTDNVFRNKVQIISTSYLPITGSTSADWYLFYVGDDQNRPFMFSRFQLINDAQIEDLVGTGENSGVMREAMREAATWQIMSNLGRRGNDMDAEVIRSGNYTIAAELMAEMVPVIWQNAIWVKNDS